jgi:hypothetical protein
MGLRAQRGRSIDDAVARGCVQDGRMAQALVLVPGGKFLERRGAAEFEFRSYANRRGGGAEPLKITSRSRRIDWRNASVNAGRPSIMLLRSATSKMRAMHSVSSRR